MLFSGQGTSGHRIGDAAWEVEFRRFMETAHPELVQALQGGAKMSDETINALKAAIDEFKQQVTV